MAPEVIENKNYTLKADVYSFGVNIILIMFLKNELIINLKFFIHKKDYYLGNMLKKNSL